MTPEDARAALREGTTALRQGDLERASDLLEAARGNVPDVEFPWQTLAELQIKQGRLVEAGESLERILTTTPGDLRALLLRGYALEKQGEDRAAASFYLTARAHAAAAGTPPRELLGMLEHGARFAAEAHRRFERHLRQSLGEALSSAMQEAIGLLTGEREIYPQQPSVFYYPGLAPRRFFEPEEFPWLEDMLALLPAMQAELAAIMAEGTDGFAPYVQRHKDRPAPNNPLLDHPDWTAFYFWQNGAIVEDNARRCPATMEALAMAPMPHARGRQPNAHWSRLLPGAHIAPHTGMLNTRLICHIPILTAPECTLRVGSETRGWVDGIPLIFDDSIEHEARNAGTQERVVLLFEIWRPDVPERDRADISRIFEAIGDYGA